LGKLEKFNALLKALVDQYKKEQLIISPNQIYDQVYYEGIPKEEEIPKEE
jgi:hypothetical protein